MYAFFLYQNHGLSIFMWVWDGMGHFLHTNRRTNLRIAMNRQYSTVWCVDLRNLNKF